MPPLSPRDVASVVGRVQAPELFATIPFAPGESPYIQRTFNLTRPCESLHFVLRFRATFVNASQTINAAEAPQSILQRLRITGTHRVWSQLTPVDLTGATMFAWNRLFQNRGNSVYMSTNGGAVQRLPDLSTPIQTLVPGVTFGKQNDTYDIEIHWDLPVGPMFPPSVKGPGIPFLWYPQDWADTIQIQAFFGDASSFGSIRADGGATGDVEFTAYGSNSGSGTFSVYASYEILSSVADAVQSAVIVRSTQQVTSQVSAIATFTQLQQLQKQKTLNVILKAGQYFTTGLLPGVQVFEVLSDTLLARTQIVVDNKPIRNNQDNMGQKEYMARQFSSMIPQGYLGFTFDESLIPLTYFRGDNLPGGSNFALMSDITETDSANAVEFVQEQVFGEPAVNFGS